MTTAQFAKRLAEAGFWVFPVRGDKRPYGSEDWVDGLKQASNDPWYVEEWFERYPKARIGIHCGLSGILVLDIDYKESPEGEVRVDGYDALESAWVEIPESFSYTSIGGKGQHIMYRAPEGANFNGTGRYRGMLGVDRRAGESYIVFASDEIPDIASLAMAPEWLCDPSAIRSSAEFEGTVKDWYETLEEGEPSLIVRAAMDRTRKLFEDSGNDFDHAAVIDRQFEAIRLGSEGHPGVPQLLALVEELFFSRTGAHSRPEEEWEYEWKEGLASGVQKYGDAIELRKNLPGYSLNAIPATVPNHLIVGNPGTKEDFSALLRALQNATDDDLLVTSVLWNCPRTRDISREWGLAFVHERVTSARAKPEPIRENPTLPTPAEPTSTPNVVQNTATSGSFLSATEQEYVENTPTFIDTYQKASLMKGYSVPEFDIPAAWTALSMAVGTKAITKFNGVGVNLWFISMAPTGRGKSHSQKFLRAVLNHLLLDGGGSYNIGANSSPAGMHEELLVRDGKASMVHHDEAASFFSDLTNNDWSKSLEHLMSQLYDGEVEPSNKIRLPKELRGKHARTSFNLNMSATPEKLLSLVTTGMFESGFLSRVNWTWAAPREDTDDRYDMKPSEVDSKSAAHPITYDLAADLLDMAKELPSGLVIDGDASAWARLSEANKQFHAFAKGHERWDILQGPLTRLSETMVKCAALLALYRGETEFTEGDVLISIRYCTDWLHGFIRVVSAASESDFSRDVNEIEAFIRSLGGTVTEAKLNHRFRSLIRRSPRELSERIQFLEVSGRILRKEENRRVEYVVNE